MEREEIIRKLQQNEIEDLVYLGTLDLSYTKIEELPEWIGELTHLESLDLNSTKIEELHESILKLTNL